MNNKVNLFIKNFSYTLVSNLTSMLISILLVLIVPKIVGVKDYGYWQLYLFYSSYVGFLHFGWNDGIYLRYGGQHYNKLDKQLFFSQFWMLAFFQIFIAVCAFILTAILVHDIQRIFIFELTAVCMLLVNVRYFLIYVLQDTNRIKEYATITFIERILYCFFILGFLVVGIKNFKLMVLADILGKLCSLFYAIYCCQDIVFRKFNNFKLNLQETYRNINVGIKLMFSNIASILIVGVIRYAIEKNWSVAVFGKISLTLSLSNFLLIFINAIGIVLFPVLKRINSDKLSSIYKNVRLLLMILLLGLLMLYYPFKYLLSMWLPMYSSTLKFMIILLPICIYEGKMSLLINTYLKTLRKEKTILKVNLFSLILSLILAFFSAFYLKDLTFTVMSIVIVLAFRCNVSEFILCRFLNLSFKKDFLWENIMTLIYIYLNWNFGLMLGLTTYFCIYLIYIFSKKKDVEKLIKKVKMYRAQENGV
ncbi:hypothetical protein [Heyndrickxia coagulans]|uniref:hypothetical protein n=1 Tax=Heyndrickxia coagulans TaxID=1398 RepID=UPI002E22ED6A|nr:hypothetical protein [Heyndrickxia coagulans]